METKISQKKRTSQLHKAKEQENTDIPKRIHKYLKFNADTQSRLQGFMLPGVCVIMTGLDLVWTRLSDLLPTNRIQQK